jgi:hypothetical protein
MKKTIKFLDFMSDEGVVTSFALRNQIFIREDFEDTVKNALSHEGFFAVDNARGSITFPDRVEARALYMDGVQSIFRVGESFNPKGDSNDEVNYFATLQV